MSISEFEKLLDCYLKGECTEQESALLRFWYYNYEMRDLPELSAEQISEVMNMRPLILSKNKSNYFNFWWSVAAAIFLFITAGFYFQYQKAKNRNFAAVHHSPIVPGGNNAVLTLADGKKIMLNTAGNGQLADQGNVRISKTADGLIKYEFTKTTDKAAENKVNMISTPAGGQYHLILADKTEVWLNSLSSISFPASFSRTERKVEIKGEAYFEVSHDTQRPFRVICEGQTTEVLGTHFNINDYKDSGRIITTLLQGKIRITNGTATALLQPDEQAITELNNISVTDKTDVELAVAWKNGLFKFDKTNLKDVLQQLGRWYDVDFHYDNKIEDRKFSGELTRSADITEVLNMLSLLKINFKINETGRRKVITVTTN